MTPFLMVNQEKKKFSIIVPVYNAEKYLERCLHSLLKQDLFEDEYEIIAVNDGSTDASENILMRIGAEHSNLRWITTPNQGVSEARNQGCRMAEGEYLLFVDSDDYVASNRLKQIYNLVNKEQLDVLVMDYTYWDEQNRSHLFSGNRKKKIVTGQVQQGKDFMQHCLPQVVWCSVYRAGFWREHKLSFLPIRHEDEEILPRIFYYAKRVSFHPVMFYYYFRNPDSFMMNYDAKACINMLHAMKSLDEFRRKKVDEPSMDAFFQNLIASRLLSSFISGIRSGLSHTTLLGLLHEFKKSKLAPLPKGKKGMHKVLYNYLPSLYVSYYRLKKKKNMARQQKSV